MNSLTNNKKTKRMFAVVIMTTLALSLLVASFIKQDIQGVENTVLASTCQPYGTTEGYNAARTIDLLGVQSEHLMLSAHRGVYGKFDQPNPHNLLNAPENSLTAIDNAAKLKYEMVELDVKVTKDNKIILMHDYAGGRVMDTVSEGKVWNRFKGSVYDIQGNFNINVLSPQVDTQMIMDYNPVISNSNWDNIKDYDLMITDRNVSISPAIRAVLADYTFSGANPSTVELKGSQIVSNDKPQLLLDALNHIGDHYPGMVVVLDLRHLKEVEAAMDVIDLVHDCNGVPATEWVILKPFANIYPDGWINIDEKPNNVATPPTKPNSVVGKHGKAQAEKYKWIPALADRFLTGLGSTSVLAPHFPGKQVGADVSTLNTSNAVKYVADWNREFHKRSHSVVGFEVLRSGSNNQEIIHAYNWLSGVVHVASVNYGEEHVGEHSQQDIAHLYSPYSRILQFWRPPDVEVEGGAQQVTDNGQVKMLYGFHWKDDGMGVFPVWSSNTVTDVAATAGVITVDDAYAVMTSRGDRSALQNIISAPLLDKVKIKNRGSGLCIRPARTASSEYIKQTDCNFDNPALHWKIKDNADGSQTIQSRIKFGRVLYGSPITQYRPNATGFKYKWDINTLSNGYIQIQNRNNNWVLDAETNSRINPMKTNVWTSVQHQQWEIIPVP